LHDDITQIYWSTVSAVYLTAFYMSCKANESVTLY